MTTPRVRVGARLAHYEIVSELGAGGMGQVFRERFTREAKSLATLNHPGIVQVDSVEDADGVHFVTMELVSGKTLRELSKKNGLTLDAWWTTRAG